MGGPLAGKQRPRPFSLERDVSSEGCCGRVRKTLALALATAAIARFLKAGKYAERVGAGAPVYLAAVLEYLAAFEEEDTAVKETVRGDGECLLRPLGQHTVILLSPRKSKQ
ncbi:hypothetical protein C4D60_Mb08t08080 [Musa balbisiana]|uniref:Histone H2A n=1 Tax=Musa balbisiana TaxID=52838 RepID=A0A4S8K287_MUSBA|nr:hypothetical protein C4D60_Mb08t08080 [Musa balbisiana]